MSVACVAGEEEGSWAWGWIMGFCGGGGFAHNPGAPEGFVFVGWASGAGVLGRGTYKLYAAEFFDIEVDAVPPV